MCSSVREANWIACEQVVGASERTNESAEKVMEISLFRPAGEVNLRPAPTGTTSLTTKIVEVQRREMGQ